MFIPSVVCLFHPEVLPITNSDILLFVRFASAFTICIVFLLCYFYGNIIARNKSTHLLIRLEKSTISIDFEKINEKHLISVIQNECEKILNYKKNNIELLSFFIPMTVIFVVITILGISENTILIYVICWLFIASIILLLRSIYDRCNCLTYNSPLKKILDVMTKATKGIQYYNAIPYIKTKLLQTEQFIKNETKKHLNKSIWISFSCLSVAFMIFVISYLTGIGYISNDFNFSNTIPIFMADMFIVALIFIRALQHNFDFGTNYKKILADIERYQISDDKTGKKKSISSDLFIAFHRVYFQDPSILNSYDLENIKKIENLTFSLLPSEFITIAGDQICSKYIFDLLLKFYNPQSGTIYVAGQKLCNISTTEIRHKFGIFAQDFCLINGTVYDNLHIMCNNNQDIMNVSEQINLMEFITEEIYTDTGKIALPQDVLIRLQIARIILTKPSALLIKKPDKFETEQDEELFYKFLNVYRNKKTIMLISSHIQDMIYADKILFINGNTFLFGSHAELSENEIYRRYISKHSMTQNI